MVNIIENIQKRKVYSINIDKKCTLKVEFNNKEDNLRIQKKCM